MVVDVNYLAILVAGIVSMVVGFLWYGPVFGNKWRQLNGITDAQVAEYKTGGKSMTKQYVLMFIGALVMAYVFEHYIHYAVIASGQGGLGAGLVAGFFAWLGFVAPVTMGKVLWDNKTWSLWTLESGYYLVVLLINGAILASWM